MIRMLIDLLLTPLFWLMGFGGLMWLGSQLANCDAPRAQSRMAVA